MHIAKNYVHYPSLKNLDLKKKRKLFTTLYAFVCLKKRQWNYGFNF